MTVNQEGLTWPEWAYAAGVREPHWSTSAEGVAEHGTTGYAHFFPRERRAWRAGEDPSEWLAKARKRNH